MVVALSVGACPGGALAALKGLLERSLEKAFHHQKRFRRPFFSDLKALSHSERGGGRKSAVLRYVWNHLLYGTDSGGLGLELLR